MDMTPKAKLGASYDASKLTVRLRNVGQTPLVVDRELVFLLYVSVTGPEGAEVRFVEQRRVAPPKGGFKDRFVSIRPGQQVERTLDLKKGFTVFEYGFGSVLTDAGPIPHGITAYEAIYSLPDDATPAMIEMIDVSYERPGRFQDGFSHYTGLEATRLRLYEGPLRAVVKVR